jgi:Grx4 family monothiol glutaredoxin
MKGTPVFPQCGFSAATVDALSQLGAKFHGINILVDPELREGIKQFSQWPTIPQLYVKGEFVGEGTLKLFRVNSDPLPKEIEHPGRKLTIDMQAEGWIFKTVAGPGVSR